MKIFTDDEIERLSDSIVNFRKRWKEKQALRQQQATERNKKITPKKNKSQAKNWGKWKKKRLKKG